MTLANPGEAILAAKQYLWINEIDDMLFGSHLGSPPASIPPPPITPDRTELASFSAGVWTVSFPFSSPATFLGGEPVIKLDDVLSTPVSPVVAEEPIFDQ
jgi:hypothetical protein